MKSLMDLIKEQDEIIKDINNVRQSGPITIDNVQDIIEKYDQIDDINNEIKSMINTNWHSNFMGEVADWFGVTPVDDILKKNIELAKKLLTPDKNTASDIVEYLKDGEWKPIIIFGKCVMAHLFNTGMEYGESQVDIHKVYIKQSKIWNYSELLVEINLETNEMKFVKKPNNLGQLNFTYMMLLSTNTPSISPVYTINIIPSSDIIIDDDMTKSIKTLSDYMINTDKIDKEWNIPFARCSIDIPEDIIVPDYSEPEKSKKHRLFISQPFTGFDDTIIMQQRAHLFDIYCAYKGYNKSDVELIENHLPDDPYDIDENFSSQDERNRYRFCRSIGMLGKATDIIFYGNFLNSKGCQLEYDICNKYDINVIHQSELVRFCKTTPGFGHFVDELWTKPWGWLK